MPACRLPLISSLALAIACSSCGGDGGVGSSNDSAAGSEGGPGDPPPYLQYILAEPYPRLVIEVDSVPGQEPFAAASSGIESVFGEILDKPGGVEVQLDGAIESRGSDYAWTHAERNALAQSLRDLEVPGDTTKIHVMFLDGHAAEDDESGGTILGVAWSQRYIAMFKQSVVATCETALIPLPEAVCAQAELLVWQHEVGHVIGLVDNGLPMVENHRDPDPAHGAHDVDSDCVMYWGYERLDSVSSVLDQLQGGSEIAFDAACLADIEAAKAAG